MAKAVVDQFEIVEVEKGEHGALVPLADLLEHAVDLLFKKDAVRQARQGVMWTRARRPSPRAPLSSSLARLASTSFMFMFADVPAPP